MKQFAPFLAILLACSVQAMAQPPGGGRGGPPGPGIGAPGQQGRDRGQTARGGERGGEQVRRGGAPNPLLSAIDSDGDHTITAREIQNAAAALQQLDRNRDGQLTPDEIHGDRVGGPTERDGRRGQAGPPNESGPGSRPSAGRGQGDGGPPSVEQFTNRAMMFDVDQDGMLNLAELREMAAAVIEEMGRHGGPPGGAQERGGRSADNGRRQRPEIDG